ncbi:MAG TPA: EF-hand domain-containing protein [Rudaea sp.]|nr:EF-hand domain-containing protein [Rudaea sp.]
MKIVALACAAALSFGAFAQTAGSTSGSSGSADTQSSSSSPQSSSQNSENDDLSARGQSGANGNTPMNPRSQQQPPTVGSTYSNDHDSAANAGNTRQMFASLDRNHRGYLTQDDVATNSYLSTNFSRCDTNGDGRLTMSEIQACMPQQQGQR